MSDKIQLIIWSRDRACQLETLLDSIDKFAPNMFDIDIIWSFSNRDFFDGYDKLFSDKPDLKHCRKLTGKGKNHLQFLMKNSECNVVCFSTDDTILFRSIPKSPSQFMTDADIFSLRLGKNTIVQNHITGELQPTLICPNVKWLQCGVGENVLSWNFVQYPPLNNYGYPFGLDMHCFTKEMITPLIEQCSFDKPNELESELVKFRFQINPRMKCFENSCAVNVPITNMSTITAHEGISLEELNTRFLNGEKLRYKLDEVDIVGCHQVLEYEFI